METHKFKNGGLLRVLAGLALLSGAVVAATGVFAGWETTAAVVENAYGDPVRLYGKGLYAFDSFFKTPIFRGTDLVLLVLLCPILGASIWFDWRQTTIKSRMFLLALLGVFLYYATSTAFGVHYNDLVLLYIFLFASSFFGLVAGLSGFDYAALETRLQSGLSNRGFTIFLVLVGLALVTAWLPDILLGLSQHRPPHLIEHYTTEITYVIDLGLVAPAAFFCLYLLKMRDGRGYMLLDLLLTLCLAIGLILPVQTLFQWQAGIELPPAVLVVKVGIFCLLALAAGYLKLDLYRNING